MLLGLPGLGGVVRYSIVERFCSTLSTMVSAGVPLAKTFQIVTQGTNNAVFEKGLHKVQEQMMVGQGMSGPIAATGLFPAIVPQMIRVGEDTGTLDHQLEIAPGGEFANQGGEAFEVAGRAPCVRRNDEEEAEFDTQPEFSSEIPATATKKLSNEIEVTDLGFETSDGLKLLKGVSSK